MIPHVERLHGGVPIIGRRTEHPWESKVTFNPAAVFVQDRKELDSIIPALPFSDAVRRQLKSEPSLVFLLYRAQGVKTTERDHTHSTVGFAVLSTKLELLARHDQPVLVPEHAYEDLGIEDGRLMKVGNRYMLTYTAYGSGTPRNTMRIATASTTDFIHWTKHGLLKGSFNTIDNKNCMIFEQESGKPLYMLHRPMEGKDRMMVHWAEGKEITGEWTDKGVLLRTIPNPRFVDTWIGGGAPPILLKDGRYLVIYHMGNRDASGSREYDLGIAVVDPRRADPIVRRDEPLLRPETAAETQGDSDLGVNNVVFICAAYFFEGDLYFPYAGADTCVLGGRISRKEIEEYLHQS